MVENTDPIEENEDKDNNGKSIPANGNNENPNMETSPEVMVGITMEEYDALQSQLSEAQKQAEDYQDKWQRALADFANLKRRVEREQENMRSQAVGKVVSPFLDVLDDLSLALQNRPDSAADGGWSDGINLIYRKLMNVLELQGIRTMEVEGEYFDPNFHEAITQEPSDAHDSGQIIAVVKPGYLVGDKVLRPAMVRVAA